MEHATPHLRRMPARLAVFSVLSSVLGCAGDAGQEGSGLQEALEAVTRDRIAVHVAALAHDSMRGRDTDDVGYVRARDYVAGELGRLGLEAPVGGSYLQPFELLEVESDAGSTVTVGPLEIAHPEVIVAPDWVGDEPTLTAEGVYVGHGLVTGEASGLVEGRVAFVLAGVPEGQADDPDVSMRDRAEVELALRAGAVAVVTLNPDADPGGWMRRADPRRPVRVLEDGTAPSHRADAQVGPDGSARLLEQWGEAPTVVGPVTIQRRHRLRRVTSWNVVGRIPGSDPQVSDEAVVFTAHLDHVGVGAPDASGDSIYNGAHDNALGVAKVLATAEAMARTSNRRSILFLALGAEESGLLGSWYYVNHPVVPLEKTVAAINHDGGLLNGPKTDDVFAWGPDFSTIADDFAWATEQSGLAWDRTPTAPFAPSAGLLYRSDHYPFLISGVPIVYTMPGFTVGGDGELGRTAWLDYLASVHHVQADNLVEQASYASPVALTALSLRLAWRLANADAVPRNHPDGPVAADRGRPTGFFFRGDGPVAARR